MSAIHKVTEYVSPSSPSPAEPSSRLLDEILEESRQTERAERSFVEKLSAMAEAEEIFERRTRLIETCYLVAINRTRPEDWILFKDPQGNVHAMLAASGAQLVAEVYGIKLSNVRPRDDQGLFDPERVVYSPGIFGFRGACDAWSRINGREQMIEMTRRSDEDFTGRTVDEAGRFTHDKDKKVGAFEGDLRSSVLTGLLTKSVRVLCGMTRVPISDLERAWGTSGKKTERCRKGHGFGSSADRNAGAVTSDDIKTEVEKLKAEVTRCVGGDLGAAKKLVREITSGPNFAGFDSLDRITKDFQVTQAWTNLKKHPLYAPPKAAEREPGSEG
jgi:hypothetical protein